MIREFCIIGLLTVIGVTYSLVVGLSPLPWADPELAPGEIRAADAQALDVIWVDARPYDAFIKGHAPDALFFDAGDLETGLLRLMEVWLPAPRPIVIYCGSESCDTSQRVADYLRAAIPDAEIYYLKGGWDAWGQ